MDLSHISKFCQYLIIDFLSSSITHQFFLILNHQKLRFYNDGQEYKANLDYDLFRLIDCSVIINRKIAKKWRELVIYSNFIQTKSLFLENISNNC